MDRNDIVNMRLDNQHISVVKFQSPKDIVAWMGAIQAQDYNMAKWALGARLPGSTEKQIEAAIDKGEIIRTHVMRPTWHFVPSGDIRWMLELTAPRIKASLKSRHRQLKVTGEVLAKSNSIIGKALSGGSHLTREELINKFKEAGIATDQNRASHLFLCAELDGIICSGATKKNKQTFALFDERIPKHKSLNRDEALAKLAVRYFQSHAPATLHDFSWWSGLTVSDARKAVEMLKPDFISETFGEKEYWLPHDFSVPEIKEPAYLLPAFDEYIVSYKDRSAVIGFNNFTKAVSNNGIFRPVILINGQVTGIWKRTIKGNTINIETELFREHSNAERNSLGKAMERIAYFWGKRLILKR